MPLLLLLSMVAPLGAVPPDPQKEAEDAARRAREAGLPLPKEEEEVRTLPEPGEEAAASEGGEAGASPKEEEATASSVPGRFVLWRDDDLGAWIKPIIRIGTGLVTYAPSYARGPELTPQVSTLVIGQVGFEGQIVPSVGFRLYIERGLGFSYRVQGAGGTSVWEDSGDFRPRQMMVRLRRWGFTLEGGIVRDEDTADFTSAHTGDFFEQDPFIRQPQLASGLAEGQGFLVKYEWRGLRAGFSYTAGRPIISSVAGGFGGVGRLLPPSVGMPLQPVIYDLTAGAYHIQVFTPTLSWDHAFFDVRAAAQFMLVDTDLASKDDPPRNGFNVRWTARVKILDELLVLFGGASYRQNEQLIADVPNYEAFTGSVGLDFNLRGYFGVGASFAYVEQYPTEDAMVRYRVVNLGATYWIVEDMVAVGLRYARVMPGKRGLDINLLTADTFIISLRAMI